MWELLEVSEKLKEVKEGFSCSRGQGFPEVSKGIRRCYRGLREENGDTRLSRVY